MSEYQPLGDRSFVALWSTAFVSFLAPGLRFAGVSWRLISSNVSGFQLGTSMFVIGLAPQNDRFVAGVKDIFAARHSSLCRRLGWADRPLYRIRRGAAKFPRHLAVVEQGLPPRVLPHRARGHENVRISPAAGALPRGGGAVRPAYRRRDRRDLGAIGHHPSQEPVPKLDIPSRSDAVRRPGRRHPSDNTATP